MGGIFSLFGRRRLAFRVCRVLAAIATGLPLVLFACAFLFADADEDGRGAGMMAVGAVFMLPACLSCWAAAWVFRERAVPSQDVGLNREGPQD